ncbi:Ldh family oxidoreductase [Puniceibacterium sp. IMCC21224]|uniref:Ldh family oxidoreductase n=1 Tax=Puniceibacterium sp. IMCC21224 TaxID=1618204 RepID=UPI00064DB4AA|nr:Ldh family oxidoreductase [Puniceibacterium sp. IMCC21224]KMK66238.1 malate/lactate dehydrogenase [Puniceibacterium sp. IMCC21224]
MPQHLVTDIETLSATALRAHGAVPWVAAEMARAVAWAEARQNRICGLYYLESYCQQLRSGRVLGNPDPQVSRPRAGVVQVDAGNSFAQTAFGRALPQAIAAAHETGTVTLTISRSHTCTALGYFTEQIALAGLIGIGMTNASAIVAPPGGQTRVIGTNPVSCAVPDGQGGVAMMFDQSTTTVALGRITMARAAGETIPRGWAVDANGQPTTDPEAALAGSLTSTGGYKGWGLGLMVELMTAGLTGGVTSRDVKPLKAPDGAPHGLGQVFLLIDPGVSEVFADRVAQVAAAVAMDPEARMPGQGKAPRSEVDVPDALWSQLTALAAG